MPDLHPPDGPGTLFVPAATAPPPRGGEQRAAAAEESEPENSPWQATVVRVSTMIAVWLGY